VTTVQNTYEWLALVVFVVSVPRQSHDDRRLIPCALHDVIVTLATVVMTTQLTNTILRDCMLTTDSLH